MRKLDLTYEEKKERRRIQMISYNKNQRERDKLNGKANKKKTDEQKKINNQRAKLKRLRLKSEGKLILTEKQKEAKKIRDKKYREKVKAKGVIRKKLTESQKIKRKEYLVKYNEEKKDFIKERSSLIYKKRKSLGKIDLTKTRINGRNFFNKHKESINAKNREKYSKNIELNAIKRKEWTSKNIDKIRKRNREYVKLKIKTDSIFAIRTRLSRRLHYAFKTLGNRKPYKTEILLGADFLTCKNHLESLFVNGMNWDNKGLWHIDHIIPFASVKTEEEMIKLCHYTNLQPLWAIDNIKKGAKMPINI